MALPKTTKGVSLDYFSCRSILGTWFTSEDLMFVFPPHWCVICKDSSECLNHFILQCSVALTMWKRVFRESKQSWNNPLNPVVNFPLLCERYNFGGRQKGTAAGSFGWREIRDYLRIWRGRSWSFCGKGFDFGHLYGNQFPHNSEIVYSMLFFINPNASVV